MRVKRILCLVACLIIVLFSILPLASFSADKSSKVVRVGWYESAFHHTDDFGRRSGYGYEYQQRIAVYTGWTYEYVEGSWSELLEKLIAGDLDLLSDVSYTEARAEKILYSAEAMGSEGYHVFISSENTEIRPDDFSTLNGKRVGVNKNSIQKLLFDEWAKNHDVHPEIIESTEKTPVLLEMLASGQFDALVTLDTYGNSSNMVPVCKVGFAESFFGINKNRPDLKQDLDVAMNQIFEANRDFNQQLTEKYNKSTAVNSFLTAEEKVWLSGHSVIRVGYRDDFLPFCDLDDETKELTGALSDYLAFAETCEKNARLDFETKAYATTDEALKALDNGEIDCVFPLSLSSYDGEQYGVIITDPFVSTEMYAVVRNSDHQGVSRDLATEVAVIKGNPNYKSFLMDCFPNWRAKFYDDTDSAFRAVSSEDADCALISNYRISRVSKQLTKYKLTVLATGEIMGMPFALKRGNNNLYSILNKITNLIPDTTVNSSLTRYGVTDDKVTILQYLKDNPSHIVAAVAIITVIILLLVLRNVKTKIKVKEGREIISEAERDSLTGLYNWNLFLVYANRINREHPDKIMDAVVLNIDRFHSINDLYGREFGDRVLCELAEGLKAIARETSGIACRFEADRFDIYCPHREDWQAQLERLQARIDGLRRSANIHLRMGVKPGEAGMKPITQFDRARTACNTVRGDFTASAVIYDDAMGKQEERDQMLLNDLGRALDQKELRVYYQPKFDIRGNQPVLSSAEALVRWKHPDLGLIPPCDFIPLFENSGQITALDNYVWNETARQIAAWRDRYGITLPVSVNLSRVDVFDPAMPSTLDELLEKYDLNVSDLKLEITESAYTESAKQLIKVVEHLRKKGFEIEMDDFGSGYSSLNMLSTLPFDVLKMDIAFIRNIDKSEKDQRLVELIVDIANNLKVPVIAEGVETEEQLQIVKKLGCSLVQGYYFSRPLSASEFELEFIVKTEDRT